MPRFHQGTTTTRERPHTNVDHREAGPDVELTASNAWVAVAEFDTKSDRQRAVVSSLETRIELFRRERHVASSFVMSSRDGHRVVALLWISGHDDFRSLQSAWDQHELPLARRDKAESSRLLLCRCTATSGDPTFAVNGSDILTFEEGLGLALPGGDDETVLGSALLADDTNEHVILITRRTHEDTGERRYHVVRSWDAEP